MLIIDYLHDAYIYLIWHYFRPIIIYKKGNNIPLLNYKWLFVCLFIRCRWWSKRHVYTVRRTLQIWKLQCRLPPDNMHYSTTQWRNETNQLAVITQQSNSIISNFRYWINIFTTNTRWINKLVLHYTIYNIEWKRWKTRIHEYAVTASRCVSSSAGHEYGS